MGDSTAPAILVRDLRKSYGEHEAVRGIDFDVARGEVFGLLGPNGAGKSTTIGMLTTTVVPTAGTARLAGYDVAAQPLEARGVSSVVFQDAVVDRALSGRAVNFPSPAFDCRRPMRCGTRVRPQRCRS